MILISVGVPETFHGYADATTLQGAHQTIARGPVASQVAIKHLGTNGGGFYNANSAVPFEAPGPGGFGGYFELFLELLIPFASVFMFGRWVRGMRNALAIFAAMFALFVAGVGVNFVAEQHGSQVLRASGVEPRPQRLADGREHVGQGGALRDRRVRRLHDRHDRHLDRRGDRRPRRDDTAGGAVPLVNIFLGEVIFGGVGSGMYGMIFIIVLAVFVAGLMVGRTPEYLGKKIEAREVKLAALGALFPATLILTLTAVSVVTHAGLASIFNPGAHGFTEALYAYTSQANNNGSAFAGYGATSFSRLPRRDRACSSAASCRCSPRSRSAARWPPRRSSRVSAGTFRTDGATFVVLLVGVIVAHRRPDDLAGAHARPDRRGADALMRAHVAGSVVAVVVMTLVFGFAYPARDDRLRAGRVPAPGGRQPDRARTARSSARGSRPRGSRGRGTSTSARPRPRPPTTRPARPSRTSGRRTPSWPRTCRRRRRRCSSSSARTTPA